jgi:hypothetical protein
VHPPSRSTCRASQDDGMTSSSSCPTHSRAPRSSRPRGTSAMAAEASSDRRSGAWTPRIRFGVQFAAPLGRWVFMPGLGLPPGGIGMWGPAVGRRPRFRSTPSALSKHDLKAPVRCLVVAVGDLQRDSHDRPGPTAGQASWMQLKGVTAFLPFSATYDLRRDDVDVATSGPITSPSRSNSVITNLTP